MQDEVPPKAAANDFLGRFREIVSDPLNLLIDRVPMAGYVRGGKVILHNGNRVPAGGQQAYYGPFSQILVINRGVHEPLEEFVFQEVLRALPEAPLMIELGAYWAHYSMWFKQRRPKGMSIMVEPDTNNLEVGRANFAANGFEGEFVQAEVGLDKWELDPFVAERGLGHIDILHVDIQGAEIELIESGKAALAAALVDYLFVSTHDQQLHQNVVRALEAHGYRVEAQADFDGQTTSSDGLVFASSPRARSIFGKFTAPGRLDLASSSGMQKAELIAQIQAART